MVAVALVLVVLLSIYMPLFVISSINVLFGTEIAWNFTNWASMVILMMAFGRPHISKESK